MLVCGIVTNGGVASTVRDAHMREYRVIVLQDGCAAFSLAAHNSALGGLEGVAELSDCASLTAVLEASTC